MDIEDNKFDNNMRSIFDRLNELRQLLKAKNRLNGETILDNQDLCLLLNLSKRSLQRYRSSGLLPFFTIGSKVFYLESEVEKFIQNHIRRNPS